MLKRVGSLALAILLIGVFVFSAFATEVSADSVTGLVKENGKWIFVRNGKFDSSFTGMVQCPANGKWFYVKNGVFDKTFTGIAKSVANGKWYYINKGQYDKSFTGLIQQGSKWYAVKNGAFASTFTGVAKNHANGKWYYVKNGVYDKNYTGLAKSITNGRWFYVYRGKLNWDYTGFCEYKGNWFYVIKGEMCSNYTGFVKSNGVSYAVVNGKVNDSYIGLMKDTKGKLYYVSGGAYDRDFTGVAKYSEDGKLYYVENGKAQTDFSGTKTISGKTYKVTNGVAKLMDFLKVTNYSVTKASDGTTSVDVTFKNISGDSMGCPTVNILLYDKNKKEIGSEKLQAMITLVPGQAITITKDITDRVSDGACYFSVEKNGWAEKASTIRFSVGSAPSYVALTKSMSKTVEAATKSVSLSRDTSVSFGVNPKVKLSNLTLKTNGKYLETSLNVTNNTGKTITNFYIYAAMLDANGNVIDWSRFPYGGTTIKAGATATIRTNPQKKESQIAYFNVSYYKYTIGSTTYEGYLPVVTKAAKKQ